MRKISNESNQVSQAYGKMASHYDSTVHFFSLFSLFGFSIPKWRAQAVQAMALKRGDSAVDLGCGTGLNFPIILEAVGSEGKILGVDLSDAMLDQARLRVRKNGWRNIELVLSDATQFQFPFKADGILSTFAMVLMSRPEMIVSNASKALNPGKRLVILDMRWPRAWSVGWWQNIMLFFLRYYGLTEEMIKRRPWDIVWKEMQENLVDTTRRKFWMGGLYIASGSREA